MAELNTIDNKTIDDVERRLISGVVNHPASLDDVILRLEPKDFANYEMGVIFEVICQLHCQAKHVNENTIIEYIKGNRDLRFDDYQLVVQSIVLKDVSAIEINDNINIIKTNSINQQMATFANGILKSEVEFTKFDEYLYKVQKSLNDIVSSKRLSQIQSIRELAPNFTRKISDIINNSGKISGTPTGFTNIDDKTSGFQPGDLSILAARPGVGKTAMALNFLVNAAKDIRDRQKKNPEINEVVVMFSMEMGADELLTRVVSMTSGVELSIAKRGKLTESDKQMVLTEIDNLTNLPILIDDDSALTILDLQTKIKQTCQRHQVKLVVVDYLGLLKSPGNTFNNNSSRVLEISFFTRTLKQMARENGIPILVLAQLNRNVEQRAKGTRGEFHPMLSDLRDSGSIEQDADVVAFISKDSDNDENEDMGRQDASDLATSQVDVEYNIAKNRKGPTGVAKFTFYKNISKFVTRK
jgi:replicative DNA helicase